VNHLRRFRLSAFALVLLSIVGFCTAQRSAGLLLVAGALAALSWYVTEGPRGKTLPRWTSNVLLFAVIINSVVDLMSNLHDPLGVLGRFQILLILVKLYERKRAKDYAQLLTLAVILMITACTRGHDLLFGMVLVLFAILGFHVLLQYQLYAGFERAQDERKAATPAGYRLAPPMRAVTGRATHGQMRWLLLIAGTSVFLISALVFVAMPRNIGASEFGGSALDRVVSDSSPARTGFTDTLDVRDNTQLLESRQPVLTMKITDAAGRPFRSPEPLRLRGTAMESHSRRNPGRWVPTRLDYRPSELVTLNAGQTYELADPDPRAERVVTQQITMLSRTEYVFALYTPISFTAAQSLDLTYLPRLQVMIVPTTGRLSQYTVRSAISPSDATMQLVHQSTYPRLTDRGRYQNSAVRQRAIQVLSEAGMQPFRPGDVEEAWAWNEQAARVLMEYLQSEPFSYTTDLSDVPPADPDSPSADDPVVRFLYDTHRGYCVHFASSLVAMCQSIGVQSRVVTGYVANEYDEALGHYIVRQRNAHAWAEVRTGDFNWATFDPTPSATLDSLHVTQHTFADRLQLMYDGLEFQWDSSVVNFDGTAQAELRAWFSNLADTLVVGRLLSLREQFGRFTKGFIFDFGWAGAAWMGIVGVALLVAVYALVRLMRRSRTLRRSLHIQHLRGREYQSMLRQLGFYLDMLRALRKHGWNKPAWKTPLQLADELEAQNPDAGVLARQVTEAFYGVRFGGRTLQRDELLRVQALVAKIDQSF